MGMEMDGIVEGDLTFALSPTSFSILSTEMEGQVAVVWSHPLRMPPSQISILCCRRDGDGEPPGLGIRV